MFPSVVFATDMERIGKEMGLSIRVQREDTFEAMHRILGAPIGNDCRCGAWHFDTG